MKANDFATPKPQEDRSRYEQAARDVVKGADPDHIARVRNLDPELLTKYVGYAWDRVNSGEYKLNRPNLEENNKDIYNQVYQLMTKQKPEFMLHAPSADVKKAIIKAMGFGSNISVNDLATYAYGLLKRNDLNESDAIEEDLRKWFREKWVRFGPDGKIRGDCARGSDEEGKPKCLPQSKAHALGKKGRASAAARKRRQDPNAERSGKAINVATKKKTNEASEINLKTALSLAQDIHAAVQDLRELIQAGQKIRSLSQLRSEIVSLNQQLQDLGYDYDPDSARHIAPLTIDNQPQAKLQTPPQTGMKMQDYVSRAEDLHARMMAASQAMNKQEFERLKKEREQLDQQARSGLIAERRCPQCGGPAFGNLLLAEKKDACYHKVRSRYKVWPSAYASGALVQCRKKGAANWGNKSKNESIAEGLDDDESVLSHFAEVLADELGYDADEVADSIVSEMTTPSGVEVYSYTDDDQTYFMGVLGRGKGSAIVSMSHAGGGQDNELEIYGPGENLKYVVKYGRTTPTLHTADNKVVAQAKPGQDENDLLGVALDMLWGRMQQRFMEFAPDGSGGSTPPRGPRIPGGPGGSDGGGAGDDPYGRPVPRHYARSIDYFGQFEADHFDKETFDKATGEFRGYWDYDGELRQIGYFKFDNPKRTGSDDPGMGWYYEPMDESLTEFTSRDDDQGEEDDAMEAKFTIIIAGKPHTGTVRVFPGTTTDVEYYLNGKVYIKNNMQNVDDYDDFIENAAGYIQEIIQLKGDGHHFVEQGVAEGLADEFMKMAKDMGMNPRLRGTPDEERARTDAMLKQRAADRAAATEPAGPDAEERARLEAKLKELEAKFDPNFEYSDDHSFWSTQNELRKQINSIKRRLAQDVAEDAESMDREFALVKKLGRLGERIVQNSRLWEKYTKAIDNNNLDWIVSLIQEGISADKNEVMRLTKLFGEIGGGLGRIVDFAWAVKEGTWEKDFMNPYRQHRSQDLAETKGELWRVLEPRNIGGHAARYYVVKGHGKDLKIWKNKTGAGDFIKHADAEAKAKELNQGVAEAQLDEKCWDTHRQKGMKKKGDRMVPNCVPRESVTPKSAIGAAIAQVRR